MWKRLLGNTRSTKKTVAAANRHRCWAGQEPPHTTAQNSRNQGAETVEKAASDPSRASRPQRRAVPKLANTHADHCKADAEDHEAPTPPWGVTEETLANRAAQTVPKPLRVHVHTVGSLRQATHTGREPTQKEEGRRSK